ncbi:hypothetical protein [Reichenbachiella agariperforans]|uniref:hypothetical protein n=1 Tax=Reichenbachiella agariperforans TaxID=156994 RepID=UPI001C093A47|nr:hypothetical protein [Reichenbachiella agariperforans]MBU2914293.1 hypothetical protein [Reichenbachiella agariperforans]
MKRISMVLFILVTLVSCSDEEYFDGYVGPLSLEYLSRDFQGGDEVYVPLFLRVSAGKLDRVEVTLGSFIANPSVEEQVTNYDFQTLYSNKKLDTLIYRFVLPDQVDPTPANEELRLVIRAIGNGSTGSVDFTLKPFK